MEEYNRRASAWSVKEQKLQEEAQAIDRLLARLLPKTQETAEAAVEAHWEEQRAEGVHIGMLAVWTVGEVGIAAEARQIMVVQVVHRLQSTSLALVRSLWPAAVQPRTVSRLARWLQARRARVEAWKASAPRAGVDMALRIVMSWHPDLNLELLATQRVGTDAALAAVADCLAMRASGVLCPVGYI